MYQGCAKHHLGLWQLRDGLTQVLSPVPKEGAGAVFLALVPAVLALGGARGRLWGQGCLRAVEQLCLVRGRWAAAGMGSRATPWAGRPMARSGLPQRDTISSRARQWVLMGDKPARHTWISQVTAVSR